MSLSALCLRRPIATLLFWLSVLVAGLFCWARLPISALPRYDTPTIEVSVKLPGASPENMASSVATPLEKQFSAIPGLALTTSSSVQGETRIILEFDSSRDIDSAAADVQAALYRSTRSLPPELPAPPSYKKLNPADAPIILIGMSSPSMPLATLNTYSDNIVVPAIASIPGVAQVFVGGQKRYAVRIRAHAEKLAAINLTLDELATTLKSANSNSPVGQLDNDRQTLAVQVTGKLLKAADFEKTVVARRQGRVVRLSDVAEVVDSIENTQNMSSINGVPSIILFVQRQSDANTVAVVDSIRSLIPKLKATLPASIAIQTRSDRSISVRESIRDVNLTMLLTIGLVILVMLLFLKKLSATLIPAVSVPLSLVGTFGLMAALGLSLDNISLMGLTIAVGLVVDDAIVVLEAIMRRIEAGADAADAAVAGATEVGFTVMSISLTLVAVFVPIFFMPGTMGRLFHEFAQVVTLAILVSAAVSLTLIPMLVPLVSRFIHRSRPEPRWARGFEALYERTLSWYLSMLEVVLRRRKSTLFVGLLTLIATVALYASAPKGFFPREDLGQIVVTVKAPEDMSFVGRLAVVRMLEKALQSDASVAAVASKVDHDTTQLVLDLVERGSRPPMDQVLSSLRSKVSIVPGVRVFLSPVQNLKVGGRSSPSAFQYTLQAVGSASIESWAERLVAELRKSRVLTGVSSDVRMGGLDARLSVDRDKAAQLGVEMATLRSTLYDAFGGRQVSTVYAPEDSYQVILETAQNGRQDETSLLALEVRTPSGAVVPIGAFATVSRGRGVTAVNHQSQLPSVTLSFDLADGKSLSDAAEEIRRAEQAIQLPATIYGSFSGEAALFSQSQSTQVWLIVVAVALIYVILGMLYESWIHPLTILMGIPSAAVGALLALKVCGLELTFIAMIGILLLVGIVKKNAIMMIDVAVELRREKGRDAEGAIREACRLRYRPIMMTTLCALMGALPIALGLGAGAELRQPLGVSIVGGLLFSQFVTLLLTPVLYVWFDSLRIGRGVGVDQCAGAATPTT